ncbi:hypothetical protein CDD80_226 [Ophiocordyceps camponoti-rufipedis]|uniref:Uncharacterized protein n=1 Tax=Ophiocordyceps camponoti-rufipedis TaxID=2004952 RepID=A0A2C5XQD7_9HYPO|nr:hypothetical protein CDD80_226 [Ophiocordyceps camponoti-rufipedis]
MPGRRAGEDAVGQVDEMGGWTYMNRNLEPCRKQLHYMMTTRYTMQGSSSPRDDVGCESEKRHINSPELPIQPQPSGILGAVTNTYMQEGKAKESSCGKWTVGLAKLAREPPSAQEGGALCCVGTHQLGWAWLVMPGLCLAANRDRCWDGLRGDPIFKANYSGKAS